MIRAEYATGLVIEYAYDPAGNRLTKTITGLTAISGKIQDDQGNPLVGACIDVYDSPCGEDPIISATSGAAGGYLIEVPAGTYYLRANPGCIEDVSPYLLEEYYSQTGGVTNCGQAQAVTVETDAVAPDIVFSLTVGGTVVGSVADDQGDPIANVCVNAHSDQCGGEWMGGGSTDENGDFSFLVPEGDYYLSTDASCGGSNPPSIIVDAYWNSSGGDQHCDQAQQIAVTPNVTTDPKNFTLLQGGIITGTVQDEQGNPLENICVNIMDSPCDGSWMGGGVTDASGEYNFSAPAGTYYLNTDVSCGGNNSPSYFLNEWWTASGSDLYCGSADPIEVTVGLTTDPKNLSLDQGGYLTGSVTDRQGTPLPGVCVGIKNSPCDETWIIGGATNAEGVYGFLAPAGTYFARTAVGCLDASLAAEFVDQSWTQTGGAADCDLADEVSLVAGASTVEIDFYLSKVMNGNLVPVILLLLGD